MKISERLLIGGSGTEWVEAKDFGAGWSTALKSLEKQGLVDTYRSIFSFKKYRTYYRLTREGLAAKRNHDGNT